MCFYQGRREAWKTAAAGGALRLCCGLPWFVGGCHVRVLFELWLRKLSSFEVTLVVIISLEGRNGLNLGVEELS